MGMQGSYPLYIGKKSARTRIVFGFVSFYNSQTFHTLTSYNTIGGHTGLVDALLYNPLVVSSIVQLTVTSLLTCGSAQFGLSMIHVLCVPNSTLCFRCAFLARIYASFRNSNCVVLQKSLLLYVTYIHQIDVPAKKKIDGHELIIHYDR